MKRPKRIRITIYWEYTGALQHDHDMIYEPLKMLNGKYRKLVTHLKNLFLKDESWRDERINNGNRLKTIVTFTY